MPSPVILGHVSQGRVHASLRSDCVTPSGEELGDTRRLETRFGYAAPHQTCMKETARDRRTKTESCSKTSTTCTSEHIPSAIIPLTSQVDTAGLEKTHTTTASNLVRSASCVDNGSVLTHDRSQDSPLLVQSSIVRTD